MERSDAKGTCMSTGQYIQILKESLLKKEEILDQIIEQNTLQAELLSKNRLDQDAFDKTMEEKNRLIQELILLDDGFTSIYNRVKSEMHEQKLMYQTEIMELQNLIAKITEKSVAIQTAEERNSKSFSNQMKMERKKLHQTRASAQVASGYYASMNKVNYIDAQFVDKKK